MRPGRSKRIALIALGLLALLAMAQVGAHDRAAAAWTVAERRALDREVPFAGQVRALQVAEYGPPQLSRVWDYRITYLAPEGKAVAAGDPVLRFDTSELEQSLRRNLADRDAAGAEFDRRSRDFDADLSEQELALEEAKAQQRRAELNTQIPSELVARSKLEKAAVDLDLARSELGHRNERIAYLERRRRTELDTLRDRRDRAAAAVTEIEHAIEAMTVRAVSAGTVSHRADRHGNKKKVGDSCWRGERVLEIPAPGALSVDAWVKEANSGALAVGQPAKMWLEAHPERSFRGRIEQVQQAVERGSELDPGPIVRIELSFDGSESELHPGMRIQGRVEVESTPARLAVRAIAVRPGPEGPMVLARTLLGSVGRRVEVGARSGDWVEIRSGLEAGDRVLMPQ